MVADRLAKKLKTDCGLDCIPSTFTRTYAGKWMKLLGAFVWEIKTEDGRTIGSITPASELVKTKYVLELYEGEIFGNLIADNK